MNIIPVKVKWGREIFNDVELDLNETPLDFKIRLFSLTGVLPDRQRIINSGKMIGDKWGDTSNFKKGTLFMMMGTQQEIPIISKVTTNSISHIDSKRTKLKSFESDFEQLKSRMYITAGLKNMGATCYLNAIVQFLYSACDFREKLRKHSIRDNSPNVAVYKALLDLWNQIETSKTTVRPVNLLERLKSAYPDFGNTDNMGLNIQQDANECLQVLLRFCGESCLMDENNSSRNIIDEMFGIDFNVKYKNLENESEPETKGTEHHRQLSCFITPEVKYMFSGIQLRFKDTIKKFAPGTEANASFLKTMTITRLPQYLSVLFVRFYFKGRERGDAKILKDIKFPLKLDLIDLCDHTLVPKLSTMRDKIRIYDDYVIKTNAEKHRTEDATEDDFLPLETEPISLPDDKGSNNSGMYELVGVVTHKGRSSSSGHYVSWVNNAPPCRPAIWRQYDDDVITEVTEKQILDLSGGGDWHTAYILLYRSRTLPTKAIEGVDLSTLNDN
ncbi:hypothetical protein GJ496_007930 [Pomphorhynchus laevis]|nr:hypothetical protein GJ496_007930 [Pomphorhynchus laevis]